ncbi:hypothetical protein [Natronobeatus ordinarius]|uniref:hypothetical protein n=1 Tax=Natronobeatus ordinarius TaxID=2963433 RepID=UPI0020CB92F6|nr:hypothetical protein [Natronobeatus ordinarius]
MTSNTVDELGRAVLEAIAEGRVTADELVDRFEATRSAIDERLTQLASNGLVRTVTDREYELTENGRRMLTATPAGAADDRIDTPAHVERALENEMLRPDEAAAVRSAFSFLRYWGEATTAELVDGVYSAVPAGYETADRWWEACVRDQLERLPDVAVTAEGSIGETWRYEGSAVVETFADQDGRAVRDPDSTAPSIGSVRHALESRELRAEERAAARAAFVVLFGRGAVTADELVERVYDDHPAGYESPEAWVEWLSELLETVPDVDGEAEVEDGVSWVYDPWVAVE